MNDVDAVRRVWRDKLRQAVLDDVAAERVRQIERWGLDDHHQDLTEFVDLIGQRCAAILYDDSGSPITTIPFDTLRKELVQLAAVAIAGVEAMDEERASWPT